MASSRMAIPSAMVSVVLLSCALTACSGQSPTDDGGRATASADDFVERSCGARSEIQRQSNLTDGMHMQPLAPFFRTAANIARDGLASFPESDELRILRDWADGVLKDIDRDPITLDKETVEHLLKLAKRVETICKEFRPQTGRDGSDQS